MKHSIVLLLLVAAGLLLSACQLQDAYSGRIILSGEHVLSQGETLQGELVVTGGQIDLQPGSRLDGSLYVLGGAVKAGGEISGNAILMLGKLSLGPNAVVGGDLSVGGGELQRSPQASVLGDVITSAAGELPDPQNRIRRSLPNRLVSILIESPVLAVLAYLVVRRFPRQVDHIEQAAKKYALLSGSLGLLAWFVGISLLVLMAFTILLIPVTLLGFVVLLLATAYGEIPFALILGRWMARGLKWKLTPAGKAALGMVLLVCILELSQLIPWVGAIPALVFLMIGFGAVLLTRFGLRRYTPPPDMWEEESEPIPSGSVSNGSSC